MDNFLKLMQNDPNIGQASKEFNNRFSLVKEEIESTYSSVLKNKKFKGKTSDSKKKWYASYLRKRIERKVLFKNQADLFGVILKTIDNVVPKVIENSFDKFVDIKELTLGEQNNGTT